MQHAGNPCQFLCVKCICLRLSAHLGIYIRCVISLIGPCLPTLRLSYFHLGHVVMMCGQQIWALSMIVSMGCRACSSRAGHAVPAELHADLLLAEPHGRQPFPRKLSTACGGLLLDSPGCHVSALQWGQYARCVLLALQMQLSVASTFAFMHYIQNYSCVKVAHLHTNELQQSCPDSLRNHLLTPTFLDPGIRDFRLKGRL